MMNNFEHNRLPEQPNQFEEIDRSQHGDASNRSQANALFNTAGQSYSHQAHHQPSFAADTGFNAFQHGNGALLHQQGHYVLPTAVNPHWNHNQGTFGYESQQSSYAYPPTTVVSHNPANPMTSEQRPSQPQSGNSFVLDINAREFSMPIPTTAVPQATPETHTHTELNNQALGEGVPDTQDNDPIENQSMGTEVVDDQATHQLNEQGPAVEPIEQENADTTAALPPEENEPAVIEQEVLSGSAVGTDRPETIVIRQAKTLKKLASDCTAP